MSAIKVWACIVGYRKDKAVELLKAYGTPSSIVSELEKYPSRNSYHGHLSGGIGTSDSADKNLDAAILHLEKHKPAVPNTVAASKGPNKELKKANEKKSEALIQIIQAESNLGTLKSLLDAVDPEWESLRVVKQSYDQKREEKRNAHKSH